MSPTSSRATSTCRASSCERGFETELKDLYSAMGDYAISTETAEFARGNRPEYFSKSLNAAALVRLDVDTFLVLDRNLETRASLAIDPRRCRNTRFRPTPNCWPPIKQGVTSGQLNTNSDSVSGIVQRARGPALFAVRPIFDSTGAGQPQGWIAFARAFTPAVVERMGRFSPWPVTGLPGGEPRSRRRTRRGARLGAPFAAHREPDDARRRAAITSTAI